VNTMRAYNSQFVKYEHHLEQRSGTHKLILFLIFVTLFYSILVLQKQTELAYDTHEIIKESLDGLEWR